MNKVGNQMKAKERALHDLNAIKMTMLYQNSKSEYESMLENFDTVEQFIQQSLQPIVSNEDVQGAIGLLNYRAKLYYNEVGETEHATDIIINYIEKLETLNKRVNKELLESIQDRTPLALKRIETIRQYKQLLDEIEFHHECKKYGDKYCLLIESDEGNENWVSTELYNIIKQLKSLGGNK